LGSTYREYAAARRLSSRAAALITGDQSSCGSCLRHRREPAYRVPLTGVVSIKRTRGRGWLARLLLREKEEA
jgi:hypothetical protein